MFGYLVSLVVLVFLVTIVLCWEALPQEQTYGAVLARSVGNAKIDTHLVLNDSLYFSVALVSGGATIQQSSFYGLTSGLPSRYTQVSLSMSYWSLDVYI